MGAPFDPPPRYLQRVGVPGSRPPITARQSGKLEVGKIFGTGNTERCSEKKLKLVTLLVSGLLLIGCGVMLPPASELAPLGLTECTNSGALGWVNVDVLGTRDEKGTVAHERKHMEQIRRFPDCAAFNVWYRANTAEAEAEAFCEEIKTDTQNEYLTRDGAIARYGRWLAGYDVGMTPMQAEALLRRICP